MNSDTNKSFLSSAMARPWGLYLIIAGFLITAIKFIFDLVLFFSGSGDMALMGEMGRVAYVTIGVISITCSIGLMKRINWVRYVAIGSSSIVGLFTYVISQMLVRATENGYENGFPNNGKYVLWTVIGFCMLTVFYLLQKPVKAMFSNDAKADSK